MFWSSWRGDQSMRSWCRCCLLPSLPRATLMCPKSIRRWLNFEVRMDPVDSEHLIMSVCQKGIKEPEERINACSFRSRWWARKTHWLDSRRHEKVMISWESMREILKTADSLSDSFWPVIASRKELRERSEGDDRMGGNRRKRGANIWWIEMFFLFCLFFTSAIFGTMIIYTRRWCLQLFNWPARLSLSIFFERFSHERSDGSMNRAGSVDYHMKMNRLQANDQLLIIQMVRLPALQSAKWN